MEAGSSSKPLTHSHGDLTGPGGPPPPGPVTICRWPNALSLAVRARHVVRRLLWPPPPGPCFGSHRRTTHAVRATRPSWSGGRGIPAPHLGRRNRPADLELEPGHPLDGLEILHTTDGSPFHTEGTVEFRASYRLDGQPGHQQEAQQLRPRETARGCTSQRCDYLLRRQRSGDRVGDPRRVDVEEHRPAVGGEACPGQLAELRVLRGAVVHPVAGELEDLAVLGGPRMCCSPSPSSHIIRPPYGDIVMLSGASNSGSSDPGFGRVKITSRRNVFFRGSNRQTWPSWSTFGPSSVRANDETKYTQRSRVPHRATPRACSRR